MFYRSSFFVHASLVGAIVHLAACSPAPMPVSQSALDPSSPSAPEGAVAETVARAGAPASVPPAGDDHAGHAHHAHGGDSGAAPAQGAVYACPMHPEVRSTSAGVCPKCNMTLVLQK